MSPVGPLGTPIPPYDALEFRLEQSNVNGQTLSAIVCEDVIVKPAENRDEAAKRPFKPAPFNSKITEARRTRRG
jgi:hypothetical protein